MNQTSAGRGSHQRSDRAIDKMRVQFNTYELGCSRFLFSKGLYGFSSLVIISLESMLKVDSKPVFDVKFALKQEKWHCKMAGTLSG